LEATQADEEENEHSEECLNAFSQEDEEAIALKLTTEEVEEDDEHSEEWLNIFSQEAEKTATWEFAAAEVIQVDIGGHPPFPTGSKQFSGNFGNLLFLAVLTSGAILRA
jgi:hypothetical protein